MRASFDVIVIGGGIVGCSVAHALARRNVHVVVLEGDRVGLGAPRAAAGFLWPTLRSSAHDGWFDLCLAASCSYEARAGGVMDETGFDPEYRRTGILRVATDSAEGEALHAKSVWMHGAGADVSWLATADAQKLEPGLSSDLCGALWFPSGAQVCGDRMALALARGTVLRGGEVREGTTVLGLVPQGDRVIGVRTSDGTLAADTIVLAAGAWSGPLTAGLPYFVAVQPVRGQSLVALAPHGWLRHIVAGDTGSLVPRADGRIRIGATVEERVGFNTRPSIGQMADQIEAAERLVPGTRALIFEEVLVGLRPEGPTNVPIIGPLERCAGLIAATAHYQNGILLGFLTGDAVAEIVIGGGEPAGRAALEMFRRIGALTPGTNARGPA